MIGSVINISNCVAGASLAGANQLITALVKIKKKKNSIFFSIKSMHDIAMVVAIGKLPTSNHRIKAYFKKAIIRNDAMIAKSIPFHPGKARCSGRTNGDVKRITN